MHGFTKCTQAHAGSMLLCLILTTFFWGTYEGHFYRHHHRGRAHSVRAGLF